MGLYWTHKDTEDKERRTAHPFENMVAKGNMFYPYPHLEVVAAVVVKDGQYLCMQRGESKYIYTSHKWEFPGGKIEKGETQQEALKRELLEEMNYPVEVGVKLVTVTHCYPDFQITMHAFLCKPLAENFEQKEHIAHQWRSADQLSNLDWAAADQPVVHALLQHLAQP